MQYFNYMLTYTVCSVVKFCYYFICWHFTNWQPIGSKLQHE